MGRFRIGSRTEVERLPVGEQGVLPVPPSPVLPSPPVPEPVSSTPTPEGPNLNELQAAIASRDEASDALKQLVFEIIRSGGGQDIEARYGKRYQEAREKLERASGAVVKALGSLDCDVEDVTVFFETAGLEWGLPFLKEFVGDKSDQVVLDLSAVSRAGKQMAQFQDLGLGEEWPAGQQVSVNLGPHQAKDLAACRLLLSIRDLEGYGNGANLVMGVQGTIGGQAIALVGPGPLPLKLRPDKQKALVFPFGYPLQSR